MFYYKKDGTTYTQLLNYTVTILSNSASVYDYYKIFTIKIDEGGYPSRISTSPQLWIVVGCGYQPAAYVTLADTAANITYIEYGFDATSIANVSFDSLTFSPTTLPCKISSTYNYFVYYLVRDKNIGGNPEIRGPSPLELSQNSTSFDCTPSSCGQLNLPQGTLYEYTFYYKIMFQV